MKRQLQDNDREKAKRNIATSRKYSKKRISFQGNGATIFERQTFKTIFGKPILPVPTCFDITETGLDDESAQFLANLEKLLIQHPHIYLSFENTISIRLPMFLLIYAIQDKYQSKISVIWSKGSQESKFVNRMIRHSGFFHSIQVRTSALFDNNIKAIPVISGSNQVFSDLSEDLLDAIKEKYYDGNMPAKVEAKISPAIVETLENVGRHAYPNEPLDENKKWWLICSISHYIHDQNPCMYLAIYDTGRGIPLSIDDSKVFQNRVKTYYPDEYKALIQGYDDSGPQSKTQAVKGFINHVKSHYTSLGDSIGDSGLIYAAMMNDMTRINDKNHGQGSASIKDVITDDSDSKLIILSNKGCYQYNKGHENEHTKLELQNELSGTLLQWSINLNELT
ncbi:hypothetical protein VF_2039 [Aliivibrio fischeri ES114]|uniref:ATP-binding protein n=1 Tax=Aliivibrio fischeri (strain ATCC 700601 / ES114) TaxID=312309 RepID=Q5E362_ALIF1|nr:hypothetical protein [Aliivibrio fischeri]AAW86534.1 hypothetical protein VF_2039 [Aliivibrio fischeri ES114]KLU79177.1 hypothetical protein AB192_06460 [Aliivibrio fischeri]